MPESCVGNYRSAVLSEPRLQSSATILRTPFGNVRSSSGGVVTTATGGGLPPPLPPSPFPSQQSQLSSFMGGGASSMGYGGYSSPLYGLGVGGLGYGGYGGGYGGFGSYGGYGYRGYGGGGGYGGSYLNPNDPENQFIQIAEESSRPAFQSIESLVAAIGNIAAMLDSTFFAITSSFRAILGVAANFGRLRGVFAQFWQTFAIFRGLTWIYKKLLYWLRLSKVDPSSVIFKEAFAVAASQASGNIPPSIPSHVKNQSPWPILVFLSFIFTAPYVIMKLLGNVTNSARQESRNPKTWINPISSQVLYDFHARNLSELTIRGGQSILIAPKEVQNTHNLLNTGWALATIDNETSGLIPVSYVQGPHQIRRQQQLQQQKQQEQQFIDQQQQQQQQHKEQDDSNNFQLVDDVNVTQDKIVEPTKSTIVEDSSTTTVATVTAPPVAASVPASNNHHGNNSPLNSSRRNSGSSLPVIPEVDDSGETL